MKYNNKFEDGEKVLIGDKLFTIKRWSYVSSMKIYTYSVVENPSTFFWEYELSKVKSL